MTEQKPLVIEWLGDAERIALVYAPRGSKAAWASLLLLDAQLGRIALGAREPALAQLKLAWWRDACAHLSERQGHPVLQQLAQSWDRRETVPGGLVDGWEALIADERGFARGAQVLAEARSRAFAAIAGLEGEGDCAAASRRWTLVALSAYAPDPDQRQAMLSAARAIGAARLPRALRPLAVLDGLARRALRTDGAPLIGDRLSPLAAMRLGIFGR